MSSKGTVVNPDQRLNYLEKDVRRGLRNLVNNVEPLEKVIEFYDKNAHGYNEMSTLATSGNQACHKMVAAIAEYTPNSKEARILDVAAGAGLMRKELHKFGYFNIDALDGSQAMLDLARSQDIYKNYITECITPDKKTTIQDQTYDAVCIRGAILKSHISLDCLPELIRITKKGGVIVFNVSHIYLYSDPDFQDGKPLTLFQQYVDDGTATGFDSFEAPYRYNEKCTIFRLVL